MIIGQNNIKSYMNIVGFSSSNGSDSLHELLMSKTKR